MNRLSSVVRGHLEVLGLHCSRVEPLGASDSTRLFQITVEDGHRRLIAKQLQSIRQGTAAERVRAEAAGLRALGTAAKAADCDLQIPELLVEAAGDGLLIMDELVASAKDSDFEHRFGRALAQLHRVSAVSPELYGFCHDTFLGDTRQSNLVNQRPQGHSVDDWIEFFTKQRLLPLAIDLAGRAGASQVARLAHLLCDAVPQLLRTEEAQPCLLHGDLWSGNFIATAAGPAIFDPAASFGHREAEFGMTTLFGGLSQGFYQAYQEVWPLEPGWHARIEVYRCYHLLNHRVLFGATYDRQCVQALSNVLA